MNNACTYRLSFHVTHPSLSALDVIKHFDYPVSYSKSVGENKITKSGRVLGGIYSRTDISFDLSLGVVANDKLSIIEHIKKSFKKLPNVEIKDLVNTGGECFYLIGIYTEENVLLYFPALILSDLSSSLIGVKMDFYGGEEEKGDAAGHGVTISPSARAEGQVSNLESKDERAEGLSS